MDAYFRLKNGEKITAYLWSEFFTNDFSRGEISVHTINKDGIWSSDEKVVPLKEDDKGAYFIWKDEKFYIKDYLADDVFTMSKRLMECVEKQDRWLVKEDEVLATLMRYSEDVVIIMELPCYETIISEMGVALMGDKTRAVGCVLDDTRYSKYEWKYKVGIVPNDFIDKATVSGRTMYFSDFVSALTSGRIIIMRRVDYMSYLMQQKLKLQSVDMVKIKEYLNEMYSYM